MTICGRPIGIAADEVNTIVNATTPQIRPIHPPYRNKSTGESMVSNPTKRGPLGQLINQTNALSIILRGRVSAEDHVSATVTLHTKTCVSRKGAAITRMDVSVQAITHWSLLCKHTHKTHKECTLRTVVMSLQL